MSNKQLLHELPDFKDLIEITATSEDIKDPALVEKDYWLMHILWGLQQLKMNFHLKGGTSLSKGYGCIHRFSEDIDLKIEPNESACGFKVYDGRNHDEKKHRDSRKKYYDWIAEQLRGSISGILEVQRDDNFDDIPKYRNGGVRLVYQSHFVSTPGLKEGILLELGFARTVPNQPQTVSSWAFERAKDVVGTQIIDNRAVAVACYEPKFTFVEKLQAVVRKFRLYKEDKLGANLPANFIRHYYDLHQLLDRSDVQSFIGTKEYESFKIEFFGEAQEQISNSEAFKLSNPQDRALFEKEYSRSEALYFRGRPTLTQILERIARDLNRL